MLMAFRPIEGYHDIDTHLGIVLSLDRKYIFRKKSQNCYGQRATNDLEYGRGVNVMKNLAGILKLSDGRSSEPSDEGPP